MSTFLGQSVMTDELCFMFIGDLSFFYDMNSLGIRYIGNNVRIVLINNNGGIEFKLGGSSEKNASIDRYIAAAGHFKGAEGWALTNGFEYHSVKTVEDFLQIKERLIEKSDCPILVEVVTSDINESDAYSAIKKANSTPLTVMQKIAGRVKKGISSVKK
jgi:2-succinyl-5-enolpyruvyl-6-hydroxy-3-cyclohexene-1-carboxylate synthase